MLDFAQKRKIRSALYNRATLITLFVIVLIFLHSTWVVFEKKRASEEMKNLSLEHLDALQVRDKEVRSKIERLGTSSGIEEEIRSKFTVAKSGEKVVMVVEDKPPTPTPATPLGFWRRILNFFYK